MFLGIVIAFPQTKLHFENGRVTKKESHDFKVKFLELQKPIGIIGIPVLLNWAFFDANFTGTSKEDCTGNGACWVFINVWFDRLIYGLYPNDQIWRVNVAFIILILDWKFFEALSYFLYASIILLLLGLFIWGSTTAGATSWFNIGSYKFQPSEFAKFASILALAKYLNTHGIKLQAFQTKLNCF